tara:strand:+ start:5660 stop:6022 length:363 start_codon:yes stop_codon:yes gene_type:complete
MSNQQYFIEPRADTQCGLVLAYIRLHGSITDKDAMDFGCRRLASRIHDLNVNGADIIAIRQTGYTHYKTKNKVHFAKYMFRKQYESELQLQDNAELAGQPSAPKMKPFWQKDYAKYAQVL